MFDLEYFSKQSFVAGCDEVGRGPLAGPVVGACACVEILDKVSTKELLTFLQFLSALGISDSKKLTAKKRLAILNEFSIVEIKANHLYTIQYSKKIHIHLFIQEISTAIIDDINILHASLLAMKKAALEVLPLNKQGTVLIDGNKKFKLEGREEDVKIESVVKGDLKSLIIGLASIAAKEYRDQLMSSYSTLYPEYGWDKNAGYPTKVHLEALREYGVSDLHRLTFKGVKEIYEARGISRS